MRYKGTAMTKLFMYFTLLAVLCGLAVTAVAADEPAAGSAMEVMTVADAPVVAEEAVPVAAPAPTPN